jgi:hypothetical protein
MKRPQQQGSYPFLTCFEIRRTIKVSAVENYPLIRTGSKKP